MRAKPRKASLLATCATILVLALCTLLALPAPALAREPSAGEAHADALRALELQGLKIKQVALGKQHGAAVCEGGSLWMWGYNEYGELGFEEKVEVWTPRRVSGIGAVKAVSLGEHHSAAICEDGTLWMWGRNANGQLGDGTTDNRWEPAQVDDLEGVKLVSLGFNHSAAVDGNGALWTWGGNSSGQLGIDSTEDKSTPQQVSTVGKVVSVSLNASWSYDGYSAVVCEDGSLWTWGANSSGRLGNGTTEGTQAPQKITGIPDMASVALGGYHAAAIGKDGSLWTWGANSGGQLGNGTSSYGSNPTPKKVEALQNVTSVSLGDTHSAAVDKDGSLWTWGGNSSGQLGIGTSGIGDNPTPQKVETISDVASVSLGSMSNSAAVCEDGSLWTWGNSLHGRLGLETSSSLVKVPTQVIIESDTEPAEASISLDGESLEFVYAAGESWCVPMYTTVALSCKNCVPATPVVDGPLEVKLAEDESSGDHYVYDIAPTGRPSATTVVHVTFSAKSTVTGIADPEPVTLTVTITVTGDAPTPVHSVTFDVRGHGNTPDVQQVTEGETVQRPTDPTATGWRFDGWFSDTALTREYDFTTPVTADLTLYAKWTQTGGTTPGSGGGGTGGGSGGTSDGSTGGGGGGGTSAPSPTPPTTGGLADAGSSDAFDSEINDATGDFATVTTESRDDGDVTITVDITDPETTADAVGTGVVGSVVESVSAYVNGAGIKATSAVATCPLDEEVAALSLLGAIDDAERATFVDGVIAAAVPEGDLATADGLTALVADDDTASDAAPETAGELVGMATQIQVSSDEGLSSAAEVTYTILFTGKTLGEPVYRLYNPYEKLHLYTADPHEVEQLTRAGWTLDYDGAPLWMQPSADSEGASVIVRFQNPWSHDHYYCAQTDTTQIARLERDGWVQDSEASWLVSAPAHTGVGVHTLFNEWNSVDTHLWTPSSTEVGALTGMGWAEHAMTIWAVSSRFA